MAATPPRPVQPARLGALHPHAALGMAGAGMRHVWIVRSDAPWPANLVVFAREEDARRHAHIFGGSVERKLIEEAGVTYIPIVDRCKAVPA